VVVFNNSSLGHGRPGNDGRRAASVRHDLPAHRLRGHRHGGRGTRHPGGEARRGDALREAFAHEGPALVDVVTDPAALAVPPKITAEQISGFALSASRTVLTGGVGRMVNLARANLRNIPRP
jgi:pyruvate dehydrogenase (quinone)